VRVVGIDWETPCPVLLTVHGSLARLLPHGHPVRFSADAERAFRGTRHAQAHRYGTNYGLPA
jgi:hypothetical protein